jgi:hypothetical protein
MPARGIFGLATFACALVWSQSAFAYCRTTTCNPKKATCKMVEGCSRTGAPVSWTVSPIPYRFHGIDPKKLDADEARGSIRLAFERWTQVVCDNGKRTSLVFQELPMIPAYTPRGQVPFGIYFRDDRWAHDDAEETLALTTHFFGPTSGEIRYGDIEVNTGQHTFKTRDDGEGTDLEAVITHEVGHYIGLAHSPDKASIMVPSYCQAGSDRCRGSIAASRDLADDDVAAVCALYPPGGNLKNEVSPAPTCAASPSQNGADGTGWALCGVVFAVASLGRRARTRGYAWFVAP